MWRYTLFPLGNGNTGVLARALCREERRLQALSATEPTRLEERDVTPLFDANVAWLSRGTVKAVSEIARAFSRIFKAALEPILLLARETRRGI